MEITNQSEELQRDERSNLDEWGSFVGNTDIIYLHGDGVVQSIRNGDPAITSIEAWFQQDRDFTFDPELAGEAIGKSKYVKHLCLTLEDYTREDIRSFCKGLVKNRSIVLLRLYCIGNYRSKIFKYLIPFFAHNTNLESFETGCVRGLPTNMKKAIDASTSLTYLEIIPDLDYNWNDINLDTAIESIINKSGLRHLYINGCMLNKKACQIISSTLSDMNCPWRSLSIHINEPLSNRQDVALDLIAKGLGQNKSLKCLKIVSFDLEVTTSLLSTLQNMSLNSVEKLHLEGDELTVTSPEVQTVAKQIPNLTSLIVEYLNFTPSVWKAFFAMVFHPLMSLQELKIMGSVENDIRLQVLADSSVTCLKKLNLADYTVTEDGLATFLDVIELPTIEDITMSIRIDDNQSMVALSRFLSRHKRIKRLELEDLESTNDDSEGWCEMVVVLKSHLGIEEIKIVTSPDYNGSIAYVLANVLDGNSRIKNIGLTVVGLNQLQAITRALKHPSCTLEMLNFLFSPEQTDMDASTIRKEANDMIIDAMQINRSVKVLEYRDWNFSFEYDWVSMVNLLCDKSSVDATYKSNHVLESLSEVGIGDYIPAELYSLLQMNKNPNKHEVARQKIFNSHSFNDVNFSHSSLPKAISCIGKRCSEMALSQVYGILRNAPDELKSK